MKQKGNVRIHSRKVLCLAPFLFFVLLSHAQTKIDTLLKFRRVINTGLSSNASIASLSHSFYSRDSVLYIREHGSNQIHSYSLNQSGTIKIRSKKRKSLKINFSREFCINDDYLVLLSYEGIKVYKKRKANYEFYYDYKLALDDGYSKCKLINNKLYLSRCYRYASGKENLDPCKIVLFDLEKKQILKEFSMRFKYLEFTLFSPNNFIDYFENNILISNSNEYEILVLDSNLNVKQKISMNKDWKKMDTLKLRRIVNNVPKFQVKVLIDSLRPYNQREVDRIVEINGLKTGFMVRQKIAGNRVKALYDYWEFQNDSFTLKYQNLNEIDYHSDTSIRIIENLFPFYSLSSPYVTSNSHVFKIDIIADMEYSNLNSPEVDSKEEQYFKHNDPKIGIFIFKIE